ncbi:MAG: 2-C-methyl-D-erythritol 4-phosphate cytidylyltransferase [Coriobacteriales bacterium]|nr:2-C-methyl-D-erythritol 4-phosphate cytidylyltransferase [Coriobacteriales bacterium]
MSAAAIIVAGGSGARFGRDEGKQTVEVAGRPLLAWSVAACAAAAGVGQLIVVAPADRIEEYRVIAEEAAGRAVAVAPSGPSRQDSVMSGLQAIEGTPDAVIVHDGARPLATSALIEQVLRSLSDRPDADGVIVGHPSVDTVKVVDVDVVHETPDRARLWSIQTPQVFRMHALRTAYMAAAVEGYTGTDDASLVEHAGGTVVVHEGPRDNIKVTRPEDLVFVDAALKARREGVG